MRAHPEHLPKAAVFAAVVREGSFSAGARAMGLARSTASEHVAALETALGARLLERTTRRVRLTEDGAVLFDRIDGLMRAWEEAREAIEARTEEPAGTLRVTTATGLASSVVTEVCAEMLLAYPRLEVELIADDRLRDIVAEGIDVAVRMAPLDDSSLGCRKIGASTRILVGAPSLAADVASSEELSAILDHGWIGHTVVSMGSVRLLDPDGAVRNVRPRYRAHASTGDGQIALVVNGAGIALMPRMLVEPHLADGRLAHLFPAWQGLDVPIYAVYSRSVYRPARVSRFLERLGRRLG